MTSALSSLFFWIAFFLILHSIYFWLLACLSERRKGRLCLKQAPGRNFPDLERQNLPRVTITVPVYNEEKFLHVTMDSIQNLEYPESLLQIIAVNDGSEDQSQSILEKYRNVFRQHDYQIIQKKNEGKGQALNDALAISDGDFFVCFDADSRVPSDALLRLLPYFKDSTKVVSVIPMMKVEKPESTLQRVQWYEYIFGVLLKKVYSLRNSIHVIPGPFSVYRTDVLRHLGGWDGNRNLTEDFELTLRIQKKGGIILPCLETSVYTRSPKTLAHLYKQRLRWYLGSLVNLRAHRNVLFNPTLGDFGFFHLPSLILMIFFANLSFLTGLIIPIGFFLEHLYPEALWIKNNILSLQTNILAESPMERVVALGFLFVLQTVLIRTSRKLSGESRGAGLVSFLLFLSVYWAFLSFVWFMAFYHFFFIRRQRKW